MLNKNICGINLKTETPTPAQVKAAVETILRDDSCRKHTEQLTLEFSQYDPGTLCQKYVSGLLQPGIIFTERAGIPAKAE